MTGAAASRFRWHLQWSAVTSVPGGIPAHPAASAPALLDQPGPWGESLLSPGPHEWPWGNRNGSGSGHLCCRVLIRTLGSGAKRSDGAPGPHSPSAERA